MTPKEHSAAWDAAFTSGVNEGRIQAATECLKIVQTSKKWSEAVLKIRLIFGLEI